MKKFLGCIGCLGCILLLCVIPPQMVVFGMMASAPQLQGQATATACAKILTPTPSPTRGTTTTSQAAGTINPTPTATCAAAPSSTIGSTIGLTPIVSGTGKGAAVAASALFIANKLYGTPKVFYSDFPSSLISYYAGNCPAGSGCWATWQSGNFQCVQLVSGAFALAGYRLPALGNAIDFWDLYASRPGFQRISVMQGLPAVGDMMVWSHGIYGHIAIVVDVQPGRVTFAQANSGLSIDSHEILSSGIVPSWSPSYVVLGYIRPL